MDAKITWKSGLSFTGSSDSGFSVPLGAEVAVGGAGDGFRPMELILTGLAACTAMDVVSILQKKHQSVTAFEVRAHALRTDQHPKVFTQAVLEFHITGQEIDETAVLRAIELSATRYCAAQAMLAQVFPIELRYSIYADQDGSPVLSKSGGWVPTAIPEVESPKAG